MTVTEYGYAKINLFLEVMSKRDDGYHEIDSVMQSVSLSDTVTVTVTDGDGIALSCSDISLPTDEKNIAYRAVRLYNEKYCIKAHTDCHIEKVIPVAAGLAGGSADAAAVLIALERIHERAGSLAALCKIAGKLGADVPFCIVCGTYRTRGIGEILSQCRSMPHCYILISCGNDRMSTAAAYSAIDTLPPRRILTADSIVTALDSGNIAEICDKTHMHNTFESVTRYPQVIKDTAKSHGALAAMMSGSGPSVFAVFADKDRAVAAKRALESHGYFAHVAEPIGQRNLPFMID